MILGGNHKGVWELWLAEDFSVSLGHPIRQ